jgi:hypothetical protein
MLFSAHNGVDLQMKALLCAKLHSAIAQENAGIKTGEKTQVETALRVRLRVRLYGQELTAIARQ